MPSSRPSRALDGGADVDVPPSGSFVIAHAQEGFETSFRDSMPAEYRDAYDTETIAEHERIVQARGSAAAYAALFRHEPAGRAAICIVADDRPGLLALISAALVIHELDVTRAHAYCRPRADGALEAVDLIWVRRAGPPGPARPIDASEVSRVGDVLRGLVEGSLDVVRASRQAAHAKQKRVVPGSTVRFLEQAQDGLAVLVVETDDRPGLLLSISRSLFQQRVQIARSHVSTSDNRVSDRFFVAEFDGAPIAARRRGQIEAAVLYAIQALPADKT